MTPSAGGAQEQVRLGEFLPPGARLYLQVAFLLLCILPTKEVNSWRKSYNVKALHDKSSVVTVFRNGLSNFSVRLGENM